MLLQRLPTFSMTCSMHLLSILYWLLSSTVGIPVLTIKVIEDVHLQLEINIWKHNSRKNNTSKCKRMCVRIPTISDHLKITGNVKASINRYHLNSVKISSMFWNLINFLSAKFHWFLMTWSWRRAKIFSKTEISPTDYCHESLVVTHWHDPLQLSGIYQTITTRV